MKCLHGEPCAQSTTEKGSFWFCNQNPSCNLICSEDESYLYEKAIGAWKSTKQSQPRCEKHSKLPKMRIVKNLLKANYGRPFFVCSDQTNPCSDETYCRTTLLPSKQSSTSDFFLNGLTPSYL